MENQELYKQAILDAKAVRETAMAAAKESLAEAFEPRIKEMLRLKLSEELEEADETMEEAEDKMEEMKDSKMEEADETMEEGDYNMEESTLDEILAELDAMSEEPKKKMEENIEEADEEDDEEAGNSPSEIGAGEGEPSEDEKVVELTVGELKDLFRDVFAQVQGGGADMMAGAEEEGEEEVSDEEGAEDEELKELSLDEILAELEEEDATMEEAMRYSPEDKGIPGQHSLEEKKKAKMDDKKAEKVEKELNEARKAVQAMRTELQEVNLLNAKLLYVNKLLKAKPLTEAQKIKVLNAFDRATTVREAENIYKTLNESLTASNKSTLKESFGYASKPAGSAPAKPIVEVDAMVSRWQTIAGIKK